MSIYLLPDLDPTQNIADQLNYFNGDDEPLDDGILDSDTPLIVMADSTIATVYEGDKVIAVITISCPFLVDNKAKVHLAMENGRKFRLAGHYYEDIIDLEISSMLIK